MNAQKHFSATSFMVAAKLMVEYDVLAGLEVKHAGRGGGGGGGEILCSQPVVVPDLGSPPKLDCPWASSKQHRTGLHQPSNLKGDGKGGGGFQPVAVLNGGCLHS